MEKYKDALLKFEREYLIKLMEESEGWKDVASEKSGINRMQLDRMMERNRIKFEPHPRALNLRGGHRAVK